MSVLVQTYRLDELLSHLRVAESQVIPSDDHIIVGHLRDAIRIAENIKLFSCKVCGRSCDTAPDLPDRAVCPEHCEDHEWFYERGERRHLCTHCGQERPEDW